MRFSSSSSSPSSSSSFLSWLVCALLAYAPTATGTPSASGADELLRIPILRRVLPVPAPAPAPILSNLDGTRNANANANVNANAAAYTTDTSYLYPYHASGTLRKVLRSNTTATASTSLSSGDGYGDVYAGLRSFATSDREGLNNYYTMAYTARVFVGSPPQPFDVVFDTGSADLWVIDAHAPNLQRTSYMHYFDATASTTAYVTNEFFEIKYGIGFAKGVQARDNCTLLGLTTNAWFGLVSSFHKSFQSPLTPMDGILGFAMEAASEGHHRTLVDELQQSGLIKSRVFSFVLDPTPDGSSSLFILGGPDNSLAPKGFTSVEVAAFAQPMGMWWIPMQSTSVGGIMPISCSSITPCVALVDTGTSLLNVPAPFFASLWQQISNGRSDCKLDGYDSTKNDWSNARIWCKEFTYNQMPLITLAVGGSSFVVYPADYAIVNGGLLMVGISAMLLNDDTPRRCGASCYLFILGDVFLKMHYTVFDMDGKLISIANEYGRPRPSAPTRPGDNSGLPRAWYYVLGIGASLLLLFGFLLLYRRYRMRQLQSEASRHSQGIYQGREALLQHQHQTALPPLSARAGGYRLGGPPTPAPAPAPAPSSSSNYRSGPAAAAPSSGSGSGSGASWWSRWQPAANPTQSEGQY